MAVKTERERERESHIFNSLQQAGVNWPSLSEHQSDVDCSPDSSVTSRPAWAWLMSSDWRVVYTGRQTDTAGLGTMCTLTAVSPLTHSLLLSPLWQTSVNVSTSTACHMCVCVCVWVCVCVMPLSSTTTITTYYYFSAQKLILIYHPTKGRRLSWPRHCRKGAHNLCPRL